jgi:hypothetical protein
MGARWNPNLDVHPATPARTLKVRRSTWRSWLYVRRVRYRLVTKAYMLVDVAVGRAEKEVNSKRTVTCLVVAALV